MSVGDWIAVGVMVFVGVALVVACLELAVNGRARAPGRRQAEALAEEHARPHGNVVTLRPRR